MLKKKAQIFQLLILTVKSVIAEIQKVIINTLTTLIQFK